jgi:hypothetical protein
MMKRPLTIVTLTVVMVLIWGCQPHKERGFAVQPAGEVGLLQPGPEQGSQKDQLQEVEPEQVEPVEAKSEQPEPPQVEPSETEGKQVELEQGAEPPGPEPQEAESGEAASQEPEPEKAQGEEQEPWAIEVQEEEEAEYETEAEWEISSERPAFYEACEQIFSTYVDDQGLVDYKTLRRKRAEIINAARQFDEVHPAQVMSWSNNEKIAFWINAHNIFTLKLIVDNYPIQPKWYLINYPDSSIMQIVGGREKRYFKVMGMEYTLQEIEKEILMARFGDPRIFFTLSYASMGGAFLRNEPYYPDKLDQQLDEQVRKFLSSPRGFRIDKTKKIIFLSDIFNWYKPVFIEKYGSIKKFRDRQPDIQSYLNFIVDYVSPDNVGYFESDNYRVEFQLYDWHLNEQP